MNKADLSIVFLGTPDFAVESLARMVDEGYNICAVVTMPDKKAGRGHHLLQSPVKQYAVSRGIPVLQPANLKDEAFVGELRALGADLFVVIAFRMLPEVVWKMPPMGTFNLHASLLPRYRGAAPINHAVMNGDSVTGVTTFFLKHEIDTGDIIAQESIEIGPDENVGSVHDRLMALGADLVIRTLDDIVAGSLRTVPQDSLLTDGEQPTPAPKIFKDTCRIDWSRSAREVHNFVRGLSPYPAAWCVLADGDAQPVEFKVFRTAVSSGAPFGAPGSVAVENGRLFVACGDGAVEILDLRPAGKKQMDAASWLRGARLSNPEMI